MENLRGAQCCYTCIKSRYENSDTRWLLCTEQKADGNEVGVVEEIEVCDKYKGSD